MKHILSILVQAYYLLIQTASSELMLGLSLQILDLASFLDWLKTERGGDASVWWTSFFTVVRKGTYKFKILNQCKGTTLCSCCRGLERSDLSTSATRELQG